MHIHRFFVLSLALLSVTAAGAQAPAPNAPASAPSTGNADTARNTPSAFVVKFKVKAGQNAVFEKAFSQMQASVRDHEPGNLYYDLYVSDQDPQTYVILEHYRDHAAVLAHGQSEHAKRLIATLRDLLDGPPEAERLVLVSSK